MRTPRQSRSSSSADRMLDATLDLLEEGGLSAVTVAAVARRAESSNGSLYHRFGDRAGLLRAAHERALGAIEAETAAAFARADAETDDDRALHLLAGAALEIFARHRGPMRAFLVEGRRDGGIAARNQDSTRLLAGTVTGWLTGRFGAEQADAEAAWRLLFALGAAQALLDQPPYPATFADAVARAVRAVARPASDDRRSRD